MPDNKEIKDSIGESRKYQKAELDALGVARIAVKYIWGKKYLVKMKGFISEVKRQADLHLKDPIVAATDIWDAYVKRNGGKDEGKGIIHQALLAAALEVIEERDRGA